MTATRAEVEAVWRIEQPRLAARLARHLRDVGLAEDVLQDAFVEALERWPRHGLPASPAAWLTRVAKNRALDRLRRTTLIEKKHRALSVDLAALEHTSPEIDIALDEDIDDDLLRLIFAVCHPVLGAEQRAALTLRLLGGLTTSEIAAAFFAPESTVAQRIVRAKRTLRDAAVQIETPHGQDRRDRLAAVLEVIYLIFNEGYAATSGADWMRPDLCGEALRLGRLLTSLMPNEPEAQGLNALMELHMSRFSARTSDQGTPVRLLDQDRALWNWGLIQRGLASLQRAMALTSTPGPYLLQAMIASVHSRASKAADTDWIAIAAYYQALALLTPSPIVEINRAVAVGMAFGPTQGLRIANAVDDTRQLEDLALVPIVRGEFLERLGRLAEAEAEFRAAADRTDNETVRAHCLLRASRISRLHD